MRHPITILMKFTLPAITILMTALSSTLSAQIAYAGDWHQTRRHQLTHYLSNERFSNAEYNFLADNAEYVVIEKTTSQNIYSPTGRAPGHEAAARGIASELRNRNNNLEPLIYYSASTAYHEIFESQYNRIRVNNQQDFFRDTSAQQDYRINVGRSATRNFWVNTASGHINGSRLRGFFMDGTRAIRSNRSLVDNDHEDMLRRTSGWGIYNGFDVNTEATILSSHETLDNSDSVWVEDFFRGRMNTGNNNEDRARAIYVLEELARIQHNKAFVAHGSDARNTVIAPHGISSNSNLTHRAYLMVANDNSYLEWNTGNRNTTHTFVTNNMLRDVGAPLASFGRNRWRFTRVFEHATVWYNTSTRRWGQSWNQNNTTPSATHIVYQAERHTRLGSGNTRSGAGSSNNQYVDLNGGGGLRFDIGHTTGGEDLLSFRVKSPSGTRRMGVYVNNVKQGVIQSSRNSWSAQTVDVVLNGGTNRIELRDSERTGEFDVDYMAVPRNDTRTVRPLQAEKAEAIRAGTIKADANASQNSYVDGSNGLNLTWFVRAQNSTETINFRVKSPSGTRRMGVYVNGTKRGTISTGSSNWVDRTVTVPMGNGTRRIELRDSEGTAEFDVDFMQIVNH